MLPKVVGGNQALNHQQQQQLATCETQHKRQRGWSVKLAKS